LDAWSERLRGVSTAEPIPFPGLEAYDERFRPKQVP
jgi:hypothetical protein